MAGIIIRQGENTLQAAASALTAEAWAEGTLPGGAGTKSAKEWSEASAASAVGFGPYVSVPTVSVNGRPFQPTHLQRGTLIAIQGIWLDVQNNQYDPKEVVVVPSSSTLLNIYRKGDKPGSNYYIRQQFKLYNATGGTLQKGYVWRLGEQWECYRTGEFTFTDVRMLGNDVETDTAFQPYGGYTTNAGAQPAMPVGSFDGGALLIGGANHTGEYEYDGTLPAYSGFTAYALADGSPYTISASNPWRGQRFEFFHRTVGFLWNYSVVGSTVSKTSLSTTPAFDAYKRHVWSADGYQLDQTVTWYADAASAPLRIRVAYSGMGLVFRRESGDTGTTNPFITNTGYFGPRFTPITLTTTGYSDQVAPVGSEFARLTGPTGITFEWTDLSGGMRAFNSTGTLFFRDTNGRNKLYPDYSNDDTPAANEVWAISNIHRLSTNN